MVKLVELSDVRTAKDGRNFFVASFRAGFGQRAVKRTFWEQFQRDADGKPTGKKYWERASYQEALELLKTKESIEGSCVTKKVESYYLNDRAVNTYSTVVFPDENEVTVFANQNHPIVDEVTGEILGKRPSISIAPNTQAVSSVEVTA